MIRFLAAGQGRVQVLEAVAHDPVGAAQVVEALDKLRPARVHLDLTPAAWDAVARGADKVDPVEDAVAAAMRVIEGTRPHALYHAVRRWAAANGSHVQLLLGTLDAPRRRDVQRLRRLLRHEALRSLSVQHAVREVEAQVLPRVPGLEAWHVLRRDALAAALEVTFTEGGEGVAVLRHPDGARVADAVQAGALAG